MTDNEIIKEEEYAINSLKYLVRGGSLLGERILDLINRQKAEIERYEKTVVDLNANITDLIFQKEKAKTEAIKEFAERFDSMLADYDDYDTLHIYEIKDRLDLVKEMVGGTDE